MVAVWDFLTAVSSVERSVALKAVPRESTTAGLSDVRLAVYLAVLSVTYSAERWVDSSAVGLAVNWEPRTVGQTVFEWEHDSAARRVER
mgnify:CR=1 FL=1